MLSIHPLYVHIVSLLGTNDIEGVNICPTMSRNYSISCDYIIGCNYSGCIYELSSTNSYINGSIIGKNYEVVSIDVNTQYNITVTDINGDDVIMLRELDIESIFVCSVMTGNAIHWYYIFLFNIMLYRTICYWW